MAVALGFGPLRLVVRAVLRAVGGRAAVQRWQGAAAIGLGAGLALAPAMAGVLLDGDAAVWATVLGLTLMLALQDLAWRWLPYEWTLPLLALGAVAGFFGESALQMLAGAALGGGLLLALQITFRLWRGVEALGTGDIWLAAGIGCFAGPATIPWVLSLAALSALAVEGVRNLAEMRPERTRWGVAYGAHICASFLILSFL